MLKTGMWTSVISCFLLLHTITCGQSKEDDRHKRQTNQQRPVQMTDGQIERIVESHNTLRRKESATDMKLMEWHSGLAAEADKFTKQCVWTRRSREELRGIVQGFDQLSELVDTSPKHIELDVVIKMWASESFNYRYQTKSCNKVCWHYTQLVWAASHSVGCSIQYCDNLKNAVGGKYGGYLISCLYGPGGNIEGEHPYTLGSTPCSNCSSGFPYCVDGLCSRNEPPSTTTTTPLTTPSRSTTVSPETSPRPIGSTTVVTIGSACKPCTLIGGYTGLCYVLAYLWFISF